LRSVYPELKAVFQEPKVLGYWKDVGHQRTFMDQLAVKLNIQKPEEWYNVTCNTVYQEGAWFVQMYYGGSLLQGKLHICWY
jgi:hypothetical protein